MKILLGLFVGLGLVACDSKKGDWHISSGDKELAQKILTDESLDKVYDRAKALVKTGFNAGTGYSEVWIRDYNTFINLSCDLLPRETVINNLLMFFKFQGEYGNIVDGFYEWYTVDGKAAGSGEFRGSAGMLATAIEMLREWANEK